LGTDCDAEKVNFHYQQRLSDSENGLFGKVFCRHWFAVLLLLARCHLLSVCKAGNEFGSVIVSLANHLETLFENHFADGIWS
jgi:hypothetical protein